MRARFRSLIVCALLSLPGLAQAQAVGDDWTATHPYEQPDRIPAGDGEIQDVIEWERQVFAANQYRYRKLQAEQVRRAATLPPADYHAAPARPN